MVKEDSNNGKKEKPYLKITGVTKKFGDFTALKDINLEIREGEFVCFVGPSGCGKTTLLRAIAGLDIQTYGRIEQGGRDISALPPSERDFGIVFQSYALFPNMTVSKNIAYGLVNKKLKKKQIKARVHELLEMVGLTEHRKKYPVQLSGGQQQRVAIARALATSPGLLLLDEPLSALDAKVRGHLRQEMKELQSRLGVTTIMVTHDQEEALTMGDRIVVLADGIIRQVGTPTEIYYQPQSIFVANFIGSMNFIDGVVTPHGTVMAKNMEFLVNGALQEHASGDRVKIAIRPEAVQIMESSDAVNTFDVAISRSEFLGSTYRAEMSATENSSLVLCVDVPQNQFRTGEMQPGKTIRIALPENAIRLYPAEMQPAQ